MNRFQKLIDIMARLRSEDGCAWDRVQTHETLKPYLIEESYEVIEAIDEKDPAKLKEELGDLLIQVVFHAQVAKDAGEFDINDVIEGICSKMVSRHPHVFGDARFDTPEEVVRQWHERKKEEGKLRDSALDGVPKELPSLLRAHRLQSRAAKVGFDWDRVEDVFGKLDEELKEFREALENKNMKGIEGELGDIFFVLVNIARFAGVNAEEALRKTISKFISRFRYIEMKAAEAGMELEGMSLEEMDVLWNEAKTTEPGHKD
jgi:tetrapyrrole methylase family protein / MazG family protein